MSVQCWFSLLALSVPGHNPIKCPYWWINRGFSTLPDTHLALEVIVIIVILQPTVPSLWVIISFYDSFSCWRLTLVSYATGIQMFAGEVRGCLGCSCRACILVMLLALIFLRNMRGENSTVLSRTQHKLFCTALPEAFSVKLGRPSLLCVLRINPCSWNNSFFCHICELPHPHFHRCN